MITQLSSLLALASISASMACTVANSQASPQTTTPLPNDAALTCATPVPMKTPLVTKLYTADPSARVFNDRVYIYPSHDLEENPPASNQGDHFGMKDYHVFSLDNLECAPAIDHGEALNVANVPWAKKQMWAPDAAFKNNTYFLYFPAKDANDVFRIGVATSTAAEGPFKPEPQPIAGSYSIDPAMLMDDDGTAYMYFGGLMGGQLQNWQTGAYVANGEIPKSAEPALGPRVAKMSDDMLSFAGPVTEVKITDANGKPLLEGDAQRRFFEGVWVHKYQGTYYLSYSTGQTHYLVYATSNNPTGPYTYQGRLLEPVKGWTTHHSIIEYKGKWYLFYHDSSLSGADNKRCIKVAPLLRDPNGSLRTVRPD